MREGGMLVVSHEIAVDFHYFWSSFICFAWPELYFLLHLAPQKVMIHVVQLKVIRLGYPLIPDLGLN